jgi:hypothetical protein
MFSWWGVSRGLEIGQRQSKSSGKSKGRWWHTGAWALRTTSDTCILKRVNWRDAVWVFVSLFVQGLDSTPHNEVRKRRTFKAAKVSK